MSSLFSEQKVECSHYPKEEADSIKYGSVLKAQSDI